LETDTEPRRDERPDPSFTYWLHVWRRVLAALEIAGGGLGLLSVSAGVAFVSGRSPLRLAILAVAGTLFVLAVVAGVQLWRNTALGVRLSAVIQSAQLVQIATPILIYCFICGVDLVIGPSGIWWGIHSTFVVWIAPSQPANGAVTGINIVAALGLLCLHYLRAERRKAAAIVAAGSAEKPLPAGDAWPPAPADPPEK
jgi:hypothetical protein